MKNRLTWKQQSIVIGILLCFGLMMIIPMLNVLATAFSTEVHSSAPGLLLFPKEISVTGFQFIWKQLHLWQPFFNSIFVTVIGTILQMFLCSMAGYVLVQKDLPFKKTITLIILITMMIPSDLILVSIYGVTKQLGLLNTYTGLILNGLISGFSILLLRNYFLSIPVSLAEAARMDGYSDFHIYWKIYMKLSLPGIATVGFLEFVSRWNSLVIPITIISKQDLYTLPMILKALIFNQSSTSGTQFIYPNAIMAAIVITAIPLIILYIIIQRFLVQGMLIGAVKE